MAPYPIPLTRRISSANGSVIVFKARVLLFLCRRRCRFCRYLGRVFELPPPSSSSPIYWKRRLLLALCRRLCHHHCLPPPTPSSSSYIPWACCRASTVSIVVSNPSNLSYNPRPLLTPPLLSLSPWDRPPPPTPPSSSHITRSRSHTTASSSVVYVPSGASLSPLPPLTPPSPLLEYSDAYYSADASIVVNKSSSPSLRHHIICRCQRLCRRHRVLGLTFLR